MFNNICELCPKFKDLPNEAKFIWLFTNEDISVLKLLGKYIIDCLDIRRGDYCCYKYSIYMHSVCHYFVSDSVRHKNVVLLYVH